MTEKILFFIDRELILVGIAKYLKETQDLDCYAIIDTNKGKTFFQNQKILVRFLEL